MQRVLLGTLEPFTGKAVDRGDLKLDSSWTCSCIEPWLQNLLAVEPQTDLYLFCCFVLQFFFFFNLCDSLPSFVK